VKIALVHKRLDLNGGTERDLFRTAEGLRDLGHDVHLFCGEYRVAAPLGVTPHRIPALRLGRTAQLLSLALRAPKIIAQAACDLVLSFDRIPDCDVLRCGGGTHRGFLSRLADERGPLGRRWPTISAYHRTLLALEKRQFHSKRVKKIIAVSAEVKRDIMSNYEVPSDKISVLYNGVDQRRFHPENRARFGQTVRARWNIPPVAPLVLFVGSGFRRKGLDRLLSIWNSPKLASTYLLIVGSDARLGRYRSWADAVAPGRIVFAGRQDEIENYYGAADVVALPSLQEAFGNVVIEALASGLPVLVSRAVGAAEILRGPLAGGIVELPDDAAEITAKLVSLLEKAGDAALRQEARSIGEGHSWERHFHGLDALLREVKASPVGRVC
jgi:UDP-glucose:(heptosyl)LPS alpha-1,3-glucosyltransferase